MRYNKATQKKMALAAERGMKVAAVREGVPLATEYKRLAKLADQRLRALESYRQDKNYSGILSYAYDKAMTDIKYYSGEGAKRFDTAAPADRRTLERKINDMLRFLNSPTSTKRGVTNMYKRRADTINKKYGTNFTWQELARFFEQNVAGEIASENGMVSQLILKEIGNMQANKTEIVETIQNANGKHVTVSEADVNDWIYDAIKKNGLRLSDLMNKKSAPTTYNKKKKRK